VGIFRKGPKKVSLPLDGKKLRQASQEALDRCCETVAETHRGDCGNWKKGRLKTQGKKGQETHVDVRFDGQNRSTGLVVFQRNGDAWTFQRATVITKNGTANWELDTSGQPGKHKGTLFDVDLTPRPATAADVARLAKDTHQRDMRGRFPGLRRVQDMTPEEAAAAREKAAAQREQLFGRDPKRQ